jgi:outer membrane protein TolC
MLKKPPGGFFPRFGFVTHLQCYLVTHVLSAVRRSMNAARVSGYRTVNAGFIRNPLKAYTFFVRVITFPRRGAFHSVPFGRRRIYWHIYCNKSAPTHQQGRTEMDAKFSLFLGVILLATANALPATADQARAIYVKPPALERLVVDLVENNDELLSLRRELEALEEETHAAGALDDPRIGIGVANLPVDTFDFNQEPMTQKQLFIAQKFPWFGKLDLRTQRAVLAVERQKAIISVRALELVRSLSLTYYDLGATLEERRYNAELIQTVTQMLKVAEAVYASGRGLQQDVLLAQVELSKLISEKIDIEKKQRVQVARINELLNRNDSMLAAPAGQIDFLNEKFEADEMHALALRNNPRLWVQQAEIDRAEVNIALARKDYFPDMDFRVGYGQRDEGAMGNDQPDFVSASVVVNIPLYQHRKQSRQLEAALNRRKSAAKAYENLAAALPHQVDAILDEINALRENYRLFKGGLVQQTELWSRSSLAAYEVGKLEFGTMINAHVRRLRFELQAEKFRFQVYQKLAELETLTGTALADIDLATPPREALPSGKQHQRVSPPAHALSSAGVN